MQANVRSRKYLFFMAWFSDSGLRNYLACKSIPSSQVFQLVHPCKSSLQKIPEPFKLTKLNKHNDTYLNKDIWLGYITDIWIIWFVMYGCLVASALMVCTLFSPLVPHLWNTTGLGWVTARQISSFWKYILSSFTLWISLKGSMFLLKQLKT